MQTGSVLLMLSSIRCSSNRTSAWSDPHALCVVDGVPNGRLLYQHGWLRTVRDRMYVLLASQASMVHGMLYASIYN